MPAVQFAPDDLDRFITITEAAARLMIGRSTAYRMIVDGDFPVPVRSIAGKQVVCLRHVVEHVRDGAAA